MSDSNADVVICGAGIAGIAAAYQLAVGHGIKDVTLVDDRAPLTLTSDKSTECYRNWWPGPGDAMVSLMNRSIDMMEELARESGNIFNMNRRGYLFASANPKRVPDFKRAAEEAALLGAGPVRYHTGQPDDPPYVPAPIRGFEDQPTGADVMLDPALIRKHFPYLSEDTVAVVHARRCGWFGAQQLGMYLLERARERGARLVPGRVEAVEASGGRVHAVRVSQAGESLSLSTRCFVNAAGPMFKSVGSMVGVDLPVFFERHLKVALNDHLSALPRSVPLLIWSDPVFLPWSGPERAELAKSEADRRLLNEFPAGVHGRPEGGAASRSLLILWTYETDAVEPTFPLTYDPYYPEIALRGMARMIPGLSVYFDKMPKFFVDGGYYTKTRENRPLIGPLPVEGAYVIGALSGFGLMAACAAGELLADTITGRPLPHYAPAFALARYADPGYQKLLENWETSGQL